MVINTPRAALPVPEETDAPDVPANLLALANAIEKRLVTVHATTAARDSATTSPQQGMLCYVTATNQVYLYNGSAWVTWPPIPPSFTSGTSAPNNATGSNGDVYFRV